MAAAVLVTVAALFFFGGLAPASAPVVGTFADGAIPGAIHVHSSRSDGRGSVDDIATQAAQAGLHFVVLTDHGDGTGTTAPTYNNGKGKDHWSIGSVMFLGPGIKGNRVFGATDEKQFGVNVNPATLALDKDKGLKIQPEHIHEALRELAGIATHAHAKKFPLGLKDTEKLKGLWG